MSTDWTVKRNYGGETGYLFQVKPTKEKAKERITFLTTEKQKEVIKAYSKKTGIQLSEIIRTALSDYFLKIGFDLPSDQINDPNQLKIFPD